MSSILNSISSGDLLVQQAPKEKPVKEDSIIELLQNSEIEFENCPRRDDKDITFDTGFGENNDLHFEDKCKKPILKTPLYKNNYLNEFVTEEEKAAARHSLGLYNKGDVVTLALLATEEGEPSILLWEEATIKQLRKGDHFFTPYTSFKSVFDEEYVTLDKRIKGINNRITDLQKEIYKINSISTNTEVTSLGDMRLFLKGFNNGEKLHDIIDLMDQQMLRFEKTGLILQ